MSQGRQSDSIERVGSSLPSDDAKTFREMNDNTSPTDEENRQETPSYLKGVRLYLLVFALSAAYFLVTLNSTIVVTAIPKITTQFHSLDDVGWYGSAYLITSCAIQPLTGKIYKHHSLKYTFLSFLAIFEFGSLLCAVSVSSNMFIIGRAVAGSGTSGIMNGGMTMIAAATPLEKRPALVGFAMSFGMLGQIIGPLIGGALTQHATWRWCFYFNLPFGAATAVLLFMTRIPEERKKEKSKFMTTVVRLDLIGFATFAPAISMLLLALDWGGSQYTWHSARIIGLLCGSVGLLCVFLCWEYYKGADAMIPLTMFRQRILVATFSTALLQTGALMQMSYFMPLWYQVVKDDSPTASGIHILPTIGSQILFSALVGVTVQKLGYYLPFAILGGVMTAVGTGLLSTLTPWTSFAHSAGYQILAGAGRGFGSQQPSLVITAVLSRDQIAVGNSILAFLIYLSGAICISASNNLMNQGILTFIPQLAPDVKPEVVIEAGATHFRDVISKDDLPGVLLGYNHAITQTFYLAAASASAAAITACGMGWINVKKVKAQRVAKKESSGGDVEKTS